MSDDGRTLRVVAYHYVRDPPRSRFPRIKGMNADRFIAQVSALEARYEIAGLESALAFLSGAYEPGRDLCMLSFDDGLKDHVETVLPILAERNIEGLFCLITACQEEHRVVPVHKNHFLMASLGVERYRRAFLDRLASDYPGEPTDVDAIKVAQTYQWDEPAVGAFKYLVNHRLDTGVSDQIVDDLFREHFGDEAGFARELYMSWKDARALQREGMIVGGHSHRHVPLARLSAAEEADDIRTCTALLHANLEAQPIWPFAYPHGKPDTFSERTVAMVKENGYDCGLAGTLGANAHRQDRYRIWRIDCNEVPC